jgi:hypothetical protein
LCSLEHCSDTNFDYEQQITSPKRKGTRFEWVIWPDQAPNSRRVKYLRRLTRQSQIGELDMSVKSKTKRKNHLEPDVVMRLFLHETLTIRNLTKRIHELDRKLAREFVSFNRTSVSIEKEGNQILELLLEPVFRVKRLQKARSQQQRDIARAFGAEEQINRLLEARSEAISDVARQQHELGKVR